MTALAIVFWISVGLVLYTHAGYFAAALGSSIGCGQVDAPARARAG